MDDALKEAAERHMREALRGHLGSVYRPDGELDPQRVARMGSAGGAVGLGEYLDMGAVPYPGTCDLALMTPEGRTIGAKVPFDGDHAARLAWLVSYMASLPADQYWGGVQGGPLSTHDQKVLHAAAVLYPIGGLTSGSKPTLHGYAVNVERSAGLASELLHSGIGAGTYWSRSDTRDDVCRIILQHNDPDKVRQDPRLQVFVDALRFELTRIDPNGPVGHAVLAGFLRKSLQQNFFFGWSRSKDNLLAWMHTVRGWK